MNLKQVSQQWGIGLTGGVASGKSTVARLLRQRSWPVIDADQLARDVVAPGTLGLQEIVSHFGEKILLPDGNLDRSAMRHLITTDAGAREQLEAITHPKIIARTEAELAAAGFLQHPRPWFYEASLLFERQRQKDFAEVWLIYCPLAVQIQRLQERDHCSAATAAAFIQTQWPLEQKLPLATRILNTDVPERLLPETLDKLLAVCPLTQKGGPS